MDYFVSVRVIDSFLCTCRKDRSRRAYRVPPLDRARTHPLRRGSTWTPEAALYKGSRGHCFLDWIPPLIPNSETEISARSSADHTTRCIRGRSEKDTSPLGSHRDPRIPSALWRGCGSSSLELSWRALRIVSRLRRPIHPRCGTRGAPFSSTGLVLQRNLSRCRRAEWSRCS